MAGKSKKREQPAEADPEKLQQALARAQTTLRPSANAAAVIAEFGKSFGGQDFTALMVQLTESTKALKENDLYRCEAMLFSQAHALQAIFMNLARRAANQEYLKQFEVHLRLALKAQAQRVRTLEVLGTLKNPPNVAFVNQANIAHGHQQVNNGVTEVAAQDSSSAQSHQAVNNLAGNGTEPLYLSNPACGESENAPNELLSQPVHATR
jgi:hypothetical protein